MKRTNSIAARFNFQGNNTTYRAEDERSADELNLSAQSITRSITPKLLRSKQHLRIASSPSNFRPTFNKIEMKQLQVGSLNRCPDNSKLKFKVQLKNMQLFTTVGKEKDRSIKVSLKDSTIKKPIQTTSPIIISSMTRIKENDNSLSIKANRLISQLHSS